MRKSFVIMLCLAVSACAADKLPLSDVTVIKATDGPSHGMDIYAARRAQGEDVPTMRGNQIVEIRTNLPKINDFDQEVAGPEISGITCQIQFDSFSATVRTPGAVHVPIYGPATPPFSASCEGPGYRRTVQTFSAFNKTIADRRASASSAVATAPAKTTTTVAQARPAVTPSVAPEKPRRARPRFKRDTSCSPWCANN